MPFWFSGQYASLAAVPATPGWALPVEGYYYSGDASAGSYAFTIGGLPAYFNLRGYWEFWAENRVKGEAVFATLSVPLGSASK